MKNSYLNRFSAFDLILTSLIAAVGIAVKPIVGSFVRMVTMPIMMPAGAVAGIVYMFWVTLAAGLVRKHGALLLFGFVQAVVALIFGYGSHGAASLMTYILPMVVAEIVLILFAAPGGNNISSFLAGGLANVTGAFLVNLVILRVPKEPLYYILSLSFVFGGIGGLFGFKAAKELRRFV